jgi:hypothetical protein
VLGTDLELGSERTDVFAGKPAPTGYAQSLQERACPRLKRLELKRKPQIVYNFLYLTGTISYFFENIPIPDVTAMRHGVAERRN